MRCADRTLVLPVGESASWTTRPEIRVYWILVARMSLTGTLVMSRSRTISSARLPGQTVPEFASCNWCAGMH
jgi:hypothetical protein